MRIAMFGHRELSPEEASFLESAGAGVLSRLRRRTRPVVLSALAAGADCSFATAAASLGIPLVAITPFERYESDFGDEDLDRYRELRAAARDEVLEAYRHRSDAAYAASMRRLVDESDVIVAAWDGKGPRHPAGTGATVRYALAVGRPIVHCRPRTATVSLLPAGGRGG